MMAVTFCCHKLIMPAWRNNNREKLIKLLAQKKKFYARKTRLISRHVLEKDGIGQLY